MNLTVVPDPQHLTDVAAGQKIVTSEPPPVDQDLLPGDI